MGEPLRRGYRVRCRVLLAGGNQQRLDEHAQANILSLLDVHRLESPMPQLALVKFLRSLLKLRRQMLVGGIDEPFGDFVPFVQPLHPLHPFPFTVLQFEGCVDDFRLLVHELLGDGATAGLGVGLPVDAPEGGGPGVGLVAGAGGHAVTEPAADPLREVCRSAARLDML